MVKFTSSCLLLATIAGHVYGSAFQQSTSELKQSHRISQVVGGKKPPIAVAIQNAYLKYRKLVPAHIVKAVENLAHLSVADGGLLNARDEQEERRAAAVSTTTTKTTTSTSKTSTASTKSTTSSTTSTKSTTSSTTSPTTKTTLTTSTTIASSSTTVGVVQASNIASDRQYLVPVTVGSTQMLLNFDTGSSDLWVFSTLLPASQRGSHPLYPAGTGTGGSFSVSYGEGSSAAGIINVDTVIVGGVTATVQAIEAATSVSSSFATDTQDGIVGLGFIEGNRCSPSSCYGLIHQLAGVLPKTLFTATLRHNNPGEYDLGFIDSSKYTGSLVYTDVVDLQGGGYWEFVATGYSIGSGSFVSDSIDAIADTGTSLSFLDDDIVNAYYNGVSGATYNQTVGAVTFPCTSASQLPTLSIYIGGQKRTMPAAYGVYHALGDGNCMGGIASNSGMGFSILGDTFLKSQFVVFDFCLQRLGFAQQAGVTV